MPSFSRMTACLPQNASGNVSGQGFIKLEVWRHTITIIDEDGHAVTSPINDKFIDSYRYMRAPPLIVDYGYAIYAVDCNIHQN